MKRLQNTLNNLKRRKNRVRATVSGTESRPRLSVYISNTHVTAQLIDDTKHITLAYITTVGQKGLTGTMTEKSVWAGNEIAKKAKSLKVKQVVFDRNGRLYHGRIKALAEAARAQGLEF
jgi:large subunit ribosomal protein L18